MGLGICCLPVCPRPLCGHRLSCSFQQRLDLGRSERGRGMPAALKLAHPYNKLWSLGQDDMAICSKPLATSPEKPSLLLGNSLAFPRKPQNRDSILKSGDKEVAP